MVITAVMASIARALARRSRKPGPPPPAPRDHAAARDLLATAERALEAGELAYADRLIRAADRIAGPTPRGLETRARLRLAEGRLDEALRVVEDAAAPLPSSLRLLRAACLVRAGRREEAHADLHRWCRRASAPIDARLLLAHLERDAGDAPAATAALARNLHLLEDPDTIEALALLAATTGRRAEAESWIRRLEQATAFTPRNERTRLLRIGLGLPARRTSVEATPRQVATLALELLGAEETLPGLVAAQQIAPCRSTARLLARAIERVRDDFASPPLAYEALGRLALDLDGVAAARHWVEAGLTAHPMSAPLVLLARDLDALEGAAATPVRQETSRVPVLREQATSATGKAA